MSTFKCKMCGGTLEIQNGSTVAECEYCGAKQTLPKLDDEKRVNLYDRANRFRRRNEFDKAAAIYEQILNEDNTDAEAYWSLVLCHYGIEYVEDPLSHRRVPTVNRAQFTSIFDDDNYKSALKNADSYQRIIYEEEAKAINEIQKGILAISQKEEPFDVFICYKETDDNGKRTHDSVLAQDLYYQLKQEGFKVFFARITLEDKLGSAYEPYIFAALNSAKVMVVLGTKPEYFNAVWVKNEWSRFLSLIKHGEKKMLIPAYKDMDPYDLPQEFSHLQAQDMSKLGFMQDLIRGIKKILGKDKKPTPAVTERVVVQNEAHDTAPLLRRAFLFLEDSEFDSADEYAEKVLDINPECAEAYIAKLLVELGLNKPSDLAQYKTPISESPNYQKAIRFATPDYRSTVEGYNNAIIKRLDTEHKEKLYASGITLMHAHKYGEAINSFQQIASYKDASEKIEECKQARLEEAYSQATQLLKIKQFDDATKRFTALGDYKDSKEKVKLCAELKENDRKDRIYDQAMRHLNTSHYNDAINTFASIADYKDSKEKIAFCQEAKESARKEKIYEQALRRISSAKIVNDHILKQSIEELHSISGYRDADDQIQILNTRLEKYYEDKRIAEEKAQERADALRRERERQAEIRRLKWEKAKRIAKKVAIISAISIVSITVLLVLMFTLVIPLIRYNKADKLFNSGEYDSAMQIYGELDGFSESEQRIAVLKGIGQIDDASFEDGIKTILAAGVPVKLTYGMGGGDFSGEEHISLPGKPNTINLSVSGATNVVPLTETDSVPETTEFTYNSSADFAGIQTPGRNGYRFVQWELESYNYQTESTFEIQLKAVWSTKDYTVNYDLAGGELDGQNVAEYDPEDDTFTLINPTRTGYTFTGWIGTDLSEPTIEVTIPKGSYGNRTYTATWKANEYTINYDAAGGSVSSEAQTVTFDTNVEFLIPERLGYTFLGWYNSDIMQEDGIWTRTADLSLVAKWEVIEYEIRYDMDGGTNSSNNPTKYTVDDQITLTPPQKTGYTFLGWTYMEQSTPVKDITISAGTIGEQRYTANWQANTYTLTFDANGGTVSKNQLTVTYDKSYTLPTPEWRGHTFSGWYTGVQKVTSGTWKKTTNLSLVAKWDATNYSITYDLNGGTIPTESANPNTYTVYDEIILTAPTRTGYTFAGWTYEGQTEPVMEVTIPVGTIGDKAYTANWEANTYTVTLDANGGSVSPETITVTYDQSFTLPLPERTGYTFVGWYRSILFKVTDGVWTTTSDVTLIARWQIINYNISYNLNGGSNASSNPAQYTVNDEIILAEPIRTGYTFLGWTYEGQTEPTKVVTIALGTTGDKEYTANWQVNTYSVTLDANGGTVSPETLDATYDTVVTLPDPTREGYTFVGWFVDAQQYTSGTWLTDSDVTLVAEWSANSYTVTFEDVAAQSNTVTVTFDHNYDEAPTSTVTLTNGQILPYPSNPTRSDYVFTGWYTDSSFSTLYDFSGTIREDMVLYAGWSTCTIQNDSYYPWNNSDGVLTSTNTYDSTSSTYRITATMPVIISFSYRTSSESYDYLYIKKNGSKLTKCSGSTSYVPYSVSLNPGDYLEFLYSKDYMAYNGNDRAYIKDLTYTSNVYYTSTATTECSDIPYFVYDITSNHVFTTVFDANVTLLEPTRVGYTFDGWFNGETKVESGNWSIASDVTLTAKWSETQYTITLDTNGGTGVDASQTVTYESEYTLPTPTRTGYTFDGWFCDDVQYTDGTWLIPNDMTFVARWTARTDITYVVNHHQQNANDDGYTLESTLNLTGTADTEVTPDVKSFEHFVSPTAQTVTIAPDGSLVVDYYYNRVSYDLTYVTNGGDTIEKQTYKYDQTLVVATPTRSGYTFGGWFTDATLSTEYSATATLNEDTTIYAYWSEENKPTDFTYSGTDAITVSGYSGTSTTMWIPAYIGGVPVTTISASAFENKTELVKVVVPNTVTSIGLGAFKGCNAIEDITLPFVGKSADATYYDAVFGYIFGYETYRSSGDYSGAPSDSYVNTNYSTTPTGAIWQYSYKSRYNSYSSYHYRTSLYYYIPTTIKNVTITVQTTIPTAAFNNCNFIETITIPTTVTSIGDYSFQNCSALKRLNSTTDGEFNISEGVTEIKQYAFKGCDEMTKVAIPANVTNIAPYAFNACAQLAEVEFATGCKLETIGNYAFADCVSITELQLPTTVTSIGNYAFSGCISFAKINSETDGEMLLPENLITIGEYAFQNLELITKVVVPDTVTSIGLGAFKGCNAIEDITLPFVGKSADATYYDAVFGYIFGYETYRSSGDYSGAPSDSYVNTNYSTTPTGAIWQYSYKSRYSSYSSYHYRTSLYYYIPTTIENVTITVQTSIPLAAFNSCDFIETITIPATVTSIGDYAFQNCSASVSDSYASSLSYWNGVDVSTYFLGSGTASDPYMVCTAADLAYLSQSVNSGTSYVGKYFALKVDINLNGNDWTPIGTKSNAFAGTFDGNGKKIYNLSVTANTAYAGLFGYVSGTIKNLGIASGTIAPESTASSTYVGTLVAYLSGKVENCYSQATINVNVANIVYAGGLVGQVHTGAIVKDSYAAGDVMVTSTGNYAYSGGFVGMNKGTIEGSLAFGNVTAKGSDESHSRNGGFVANNSGTLLECYRVETQTLTQNTTIGSAYNDEASVSTYEAMISYAQTNWDFSAWEFDLRYPRHDHFYYVDTNAENTKAGTVSQSKVYHCDDVATITASTNDGYTFVGWYCGKDLVSTNLSYEFAVTNNVIIVAKWTANDATYTVNYYREKYTSNGYVTELIETETLPSKTGESVSAIVKNYDRFSFSEYTSNLNGEVAWDNSLVLEVRYRADYDREGDYIYFGEYPQTIKADDVTITDVVDDRGYYLGSDGDYYAKVIGVRDSYAFSTGEMVYKGKTYYFKVEPIRWRILTEDGGKAFIVCDSIIENMAYDAGSDNNYKDSDVRAWLNETFYDVAFNDIQRALMLTTTIDNSKESTGFSNNPYTCEDTTDKIFLLSYAEATNSDYFASNSDRQKLASDYCRANGITLNGLAFGRGYNTSWWLRSPNYYYGATNSARVIYSSGGTSGDSMKADSTLHGIVPAMWIQL